MAALRDFFKRVMLEGVTAHDGSDPVSDYLAKIGKRGGKVTGVAKGFAAGDNARKAAEARWGKKRAAKKKAGAGKANKKAGK